MNKIPTITKNLLIINVLFYMGTLALQKYGIDVHSLFGLHFFKASGFRIYQLLTYMFLHEGFQHIFFKGKVVCRICGTGLQVVNSHGKAPF